ncbi:succinate dehydrogenase [Paenirhodobacter sp.]|uniref:succinate dehydrogenase n=1 Tax=Paenirhodobacter sp. TaxID=1965326 RepID=UPI003B40F863
MRWLPALVLGLSACTLGQSAEEVARNQAKSVVNTVVAQKMPGVNATPVTDCVIDNASMPEIYTISKGAVVGVSPDTVNAVMTIAQRPATMQCVAQKGMGLL